MPKPLIALTPEAAEERNRRGAAMLVDIREADEFARRRIPGARSHPLSRLDAAPMPQADVIFTCRSGRRTSEQAPLLAHAAPGPAYELAGGLEAWAAAGLLLEVDRKAPLEIMRQVQIVAGSLVLAGVLLGLLLSQAFFGLAAFVGAGLMFAGISGFCGMAKLLAFLPWNRPAVP